MKISDRLRRLKKVMGSKIKHTITPYAGFTQNDEYCELLHIDVSGIYDISLVVKSEGVLYLPEEDDLYDMFIIERIPLVAKHSGRTWWHTYESKHSTVKNVFFTASDHNTSLLTKFDPAMIPILEEELEKLELNINLQLSLSTGSSSLSNMMKEYGFNKDICNKFIVNDGNINAIRSISGDDYYLGKGSPDKLLSIADLIHNREEMSIQLGLMKMSKNKIN